MEPKVSKEDILEVIGKYRIEGEEPSIRDISDELEVELWEVGQAVGEYGIKFNRDNISPPSNVTHISRVVPPQDIGITDDFGELVEDTPPEIETFSLDSEEWQQAPKRIKDLYKFLSAKKRAGGVPILEACDHMNVGPSRINEMVDEILDRGKYLVRSDDGQTISASTLPEREGRTLSVDADNLIIYKKPGKKNAFFKILVLSDTHLCSKAQQITYLGEVMAEYAGEDDISLIVHAGDLTDGNGCYTGHANEIFLSMPDDQLEYALAAFPQSDRPGYIIGGNHDHTHVQKRGTHVVERFCDLRDEWTFLGDYNARLRLGEVEIMLYHGEGGIGENPWLKLSKVVKGMPRDNTPDMVLCGHWHVRGYYGYRGVEVYALSAFQGLTNYLARKSIDPMVGHMVLEIEIDDSGNMVGHTPNFWNLRKPRLDDYPTVDVLGQSIGGYAQKSLGA